MSSSWPILPLESVLKERCENPDKITVAKGIIPIISKITFNEGQAILRKEGGSKTDMILVCPGDLLISGINAAKGAIAIYNPENGEPAAATIHYSAYQVIKEKADVKYLWWYLRSKSFRKILMESLPNGIKSELRAKRLLQIKIPIPSIEEQRRIVVRIEELSSWINEAILLKKEIIQFTKIFMTCIIGNQMEKIEKTGVLGEVVTFKPRSGPSFVTSANWSGMPVLMPSSTTGFGLDYLKVEYGLGYEKINEKDRLQAGDIVIARGNKRDQVGNAGIVSPEAEGFVCANLLMRMKVDENRVDSHFLIYWLRSPFMRKYVLTHMKGTNPNIQKINQQTILNYPYPTKLLLDDQRRMVQYLDKMQEFCDDLSKKEAESFAELEALLPSILHMAFKGEL